MKIRICFRFPLLDAVPSSGDLTYIGSTFDSPDLQPMEITHLERRMQSITKVPLRTLCAWRE
jgi:hypothetical protein